MKPTAATSTLVIEDTVLDRRLRRPGDLARFAFTLIAIAAVALLAYVAQSTTTGIEKDIYQGARRLPAAIILITNLISGLGTLIFPAVVALDLLIRKRPRQLMESVGGLLVSVLILSLITWALIQSDSERLLLAFAGTTDPLTAVPFNAVIGGIAAFTTVSRIMSRPRWNVVAGIVISSIALADIVAGGVTAAGLATSLLAGWAVGLLIRYLLGTDTTRPSGGEIAKVMDGLGIPLTLLRAAEVLKSGRRYDASTIDGARIDLIVLDRDLEGAGLAQGIYRSLRLRDDTAGSGTSMRRHLERIALNSWAISTAGISTQHLLAVAEVGPDAALLAFEHVPGRSFSDVGHTLGDAELAGAWEIVRDLQAARIAHRALNAENFLQAADGKVYIQGIKDGAVAASDVLLRIDLAEALVTLSLAADPIRAIQAGKVVLGSTALARALPALQLVALGATTRELLKENRELLTTLRTAVLDELPETAIENEQIDIERIKPRTLFTVIAGSVAAYLLLTQLGKVNLGEVFRVADTSWVLIGLGFSALTYVAATMALAGVVPERLSFWKTLQAQFAASFATLVTPPTLGSVAINVRYLSKQGMHAALAGASIAVAQALAFLSHIILLFIAVVAAGTSSDFTFRPPRTAIIVFLVIALTVTALLTIPNIRTWAGEKLQPIFSQVVPRLSSLANQPAKLATGVVGVLLLNISYCLCLVASVRAFTPNASIAAIALVYLAAAVVGQAAPTPGGLGAVEAAMAAGLTAAGIDPGIAISATLIFRLLTFWIPTIPGWLALRNLQRTGDL
ncbi:MAG: flippase-like domain-containing protein [Candidatus Nanopelagicales bacterium]|nr:flippase-like domain-containing protein [Candidatus Nanopelagicales bacterium]